MTLLLSCWKREIEFNEEIKDYLSPSLKRHAYKFASRSRQHTFDDFFSIGLISAWKAVESFRMVCSECKKKFKTVKTFIRHSVKVHKRIVAPLYKIESYVGLRLISSMQHELKKEYALKRCPTSSIIISIEKCSPVSSRDKTDFELRDLIETIVKDYQETERMIIGRIIKSYDTSEIVNELEELFGFDLSILRMVRQVKKKFALAIKQSLSRAS